MYVNIQQSELFVQQKDFDENECCKNTTFTL